MADSEIQALRAGPELISGAAIPFRFEITWRSLTRSLEPTQDLSLERIPVLPPRRAPARDVEAKEWEMVLPRMRRRVAIGPVTTEPDPRPVAAPSFAIETGGGPRNRWIAIAGVAALLLSIVAVARWTGKDPSPANGQATAAMDMGGAGWSTEWAADRTGSIRGRQISLYRPSMSMSDYRLQFLGRIEQKSLGWVFRATDARNYYVAKLEALRPGASSSPLAVTRFAVIGGVEGPHMQRVLAHSPGDALKVKLEARGSRFTVYVQNQVVEDWQDDRLKSGAVGFLNEREERGKVESIQISFLRGAIH